MNCPKCNGSTRCVDSRVTANGNRVRRRRECEQCKFRFRTHEEREEPLHPRAFEGLSMHTLAEMERELIRRVDLVFREA